MHLLWTNFPNFSFSFIFKYFLIFTRNRNCYIRIVDTRVLKFIRETSNCYARRTIALSSQRLKFSFFCIRSSAKFLSFYEEIIDANVFPFILFCRITYDQFYSVEINTATFHRLGFTFAPVVKDTFAKERNSSDNLIVSFNILFTIFPHGGGRNLCSFPCVWFPNDIASVINYMRNK